MKIQSTTMREVCITNITQNRPAKVICERYTVPWSAKEKEMRDLINN